MASSIIDLKKSFLQTQVRILSSPLEPSPRWRNAGPSTEEGALKDKAVQEVVRKLNNIVRQHNRTVYTSQAFRHIAEQIDALFWTAGEPDLSSNDIDGAIDRGADLRDHEMIQSLPEVWMEENLRDSSGLEQFAESTRYKQLVNRLRGLNSTRIAQQKRIAELKFLCQLLDTYQQAQINIQPNLVTKDGELSTELERMKILIARLGEKIRSLKAKGAGSGLGVSGATEP